MESGQSSHGTNRPMQLMSMNIFGYDVGGEVTPDHDDRKPNITDQTPFGKSDWNNQTKSVHVPWWLQHREASSDQNCDKYLSETSAFAPPGAMFESLPFPACDGLSDFNTDLSYDLYVRRGFGPTSNELDAWKLNEDMGNQFSSTQHQAQNHISWMQNSNGDSSCNYVSRVDTPNVRVAAPVGSPTQPRSRASYAKSRANDRRRRIQIAEKLTALQELLPQSGKGGQASVLDDIIDYVKNLQLQIKDLCRSKTRLECDSTTEPLILREGFGHYFCNEQVLKEPLEEMVGKLLELSPVEASQLLEMKGLLLMPIEFTQAFC